METQSRQVRTDWDIVSPHPIVVYSDEDMESMLRLIDVLYGKPFKCVLGGRKNNRFASLCFALLRPSEENWGEPPFKGGFIRDASRRLATLRDASPL